MLRHDPSGRGRTVENGHPQIHQHDVRTRLRDQLARLRAVGGLADHLDVGKQPEHGHESVAHDRLIIGNEHPDRIGIAHSSTSASTTKSSLRTPVFSRALGSSANRSAMPSRPLPPPEVTSSLLGPV